MKFKTPLKAKIMSYLIMPVLLFSYTVGAIFAIFSMLIDKIKRGFKNG